ncbi:MAG: hypothetical protein IT531_17660 [Burkholderiales bacterium]|nr:hypothetical protein [Burkholderiales bacterium]
MSPSEAYREIVWIKDGYRLIDAESYERTYSAAEGRTLPTGYYIAEWPAGTANPHFLHDGLTFTGPFPNRHRAAAALQEPFGAAQTA